MHYLQEILSLKETIKYIVFVSLSENKTVPIELNKFVFGDIIALM